MHLRTSQICQNGFWDRFGMIFSVFFTLKLRNSASIDAYILCRHSLNDLVDAEQCLLKKNIDNQKYFNKNHFVELHVELQVAFHRDIPIPVSE